VRQNADKIKRAEIINGVPRFLKNNATFAGINLNSNITIKQQEIKNVAIQKYISYDRNWEKVYFDEHNGGYFVVDKQRIEHSKLSKNETEKFEKEYSMCMVLARYGYKIEMLKESRGFSSPDITINGIMAELKKTSSHNNMLDYAKKAVYKQGAKIVIFEFFEMTGKIRYELNKIKRMGIEVKYFISADKIIFEL